MPGQPWGNAFTVQSNGAPVETPGLGKFSRTSNLSLKLDSRWANNYGYRPIEVTFTAPKPTTANQLITIRLHTGWFRFARGSIVVEQDFEMLQGSTTMSATIAFPQYQLDPQYFWWEVWVDGVKDNDLSLDERSARSAMAAAIMPPGGTSGLSILAVGPNGRQRWLTAPNTQEFEVLSLPVTQFPKRWIEYTSFEVVSLSHVELQRIAQSSPDALAAIRQWVRTGGQAWISDAGTEFEQLESISKLIGVSDTLLGISDGLTNKDVKHDPHASTADAWSPTRFGRRRRTGEVVTFLDLRTQSRLVARDRDTINRLQLDPNFAAITREFAPDDESPRRRSPRDSSRWFVDQQLGLGLVRAFRGDQASLLFPSTQRGEVDPDPATDRMAAPDSTSSPLSMALRSTPNWSTRHGMTPDDANRDFADFLVPGVGLAPVTEFRILITLFVLLIGPANYWLLKRTGRLHLLVLTVPLAALLMTTALFGYAILSDGFGTTVRAQSLTVLDQRAGDATCWARLSYYSGVAPRGGLTMPSDVAIYPIIPDWNTSNFDANIGARRELIWEPNEARLTQGWLRSRTPTQYLTVRARKSPLRVDLTPVGDGLRAANELGAAIRYLLVADKEGRFFAGENVEDGAKAELVATERVAAIKRVRQLFSDNQPEAPPALMDESEFTILQRRQTRRMMSRQFGVEIGNQRLDSNLLNNTLADLVGISGQPALQLPPGSFVAVTDTGPEVALGISGAEEEASFHVVMGRW